MKHPCCGFWGRCSIPAAAVVCLVALRLACGWHFFKEGQKKFVDPAFTSAGFLRQATGPVEPFFKGLLTEFHGWPEHLARPLDRLSASDGAGGPRASAAGESEGPVARDRPYTEWADRVLADWRAGLSGLMESAKLEEAQRREAAEVLERRSQQLADYLDQLDEEIETYRYELGRLAEMESSVGSAAIPHLAERIALKRAETSAMVAPWIADVRRIEQGLESDLRERLPADRRGLLFAFSPPESPRWVDLTVTYWTLGVGVCLMLGLFTRLAALAGAAFVLAVIGTQPPWVPGAQLMFFYYQLVEVCALLVLATTAVGRWGGLDFFLHSFLGTRAAKEQA